MGYQAFTYVALGDSTGVGVGAHDARGYVARLFDRIKTIRPGARLVNLCESGATSSSVAHVQLRRAVSERPDLATVFVGANDLWWNTPTGYMENMRQITSQLRAHAGFTVVCTIPNLAHSPAASLATAAQRAMLEGRIESINEQLRTLARTHEHGLLDLAAIGLADRPHFFSGDGFHPSAAGYDALAKQLWWVIVRVLARQSGQAQP